MKKRLSFGAIIFSALMALFPLGDVFAAKTMIKEASPLDANYVSNVTLSLPELDSSNKYDLVYVLDMSEVEAKTVDKYVELIQKLKERITGEDIEVKIAFTMFKGVSVGTDWIDLQNTTYDEVLNILSDLMAELKSLSKGGTNMPSGLLHAKEILESDMNVLDSNKYIFFVTDGIGFEFVNDNLTEKYNNAHGTDFKTYEQGWVLPIWQTACTDDSTIMNGGGDLTTESWTETDWMNYLKYVEDNYGDYIQNAYNYHHDERPTPVPTPQGPNPVLGVDLDLYQTYYYFNQMDQKYNTYAIPLPTTSGYKWGTFFMNFLARNNSTDVVEITQELFSNITDGISKKIVLDEIGKTAEYEFDVINNLEDYNILLDGKALIKKELSKNVYVFGSQFKRNGVMLWPAILEYTPDSATENERLDFTINMSLAKYNSVKLAYKVKLKNPDSVADKTNLKTNNYANLKAFDDSGRVLFDHDFNVPEASYDPEYKPDDGNYSSTDYCEEGNICEDPDDDLPDVPYTFDNGIVVWCVLSAISLAGIAMSVKRELTKK
ncbi:MAG: VWA domain-containing protein [Candidatus Saccharibacteria bacterium]|nr:VWA domain-containing protein [Candidatus Saccharibacteria bacterium]